MDETTDANGRYIAYFIVGKLSSESSKPFLLFCEELEKCNSKTTSILVCRLFNNCNGCFAAKWYSTQ